MVKKRMKNKTIPERMCVGCRMMKSRSLMTRIVKTLDDGIVIDVSGKVQGRGAYLCNNKECLKKARKNRGFERSFKTSVPESVYEALEKEMDES